VHVEKAYGDSNSTAALILNLITRQTWSAAHPSCFTPREELLVFIELEAGWASKLISIL
jgi:hypothetical protein